MPTFITLVNYTEEGMETLSELAAEEFLAETTRIIEAHGGDVKDFYFTLGQYDAVGIAEFPDAKTATQAVMETVSDGIAETETLYAFDEDQARELVGALGS